MSKIITVTGYNGKKNRAALTVSSLAAMTAMKLNQKTLVIQLVDNNIDTIEGIMAGIGREENMLREEKVIEDEGIDTLLRMVETQKLMKQDFDQAVTPILKAENRLDIASITSNANFVQQLPIKVNEVEQMLMNAKDVYDYIYVLLPTSYASIIKTINELVVDTQASGKKKGSQNDDEEIRRKPLVDAAIYCVRQGFKMKANVYGQNVLYVLTDYDNDSKYKLTDMSKVYCDQTGIIGKKTRREKIFKIMRNAGLNDAMLEGRLAAYVREHRELLEDDATYEWTSDILKILNYISDGNMEEETNEQWEYEKIPEKKTAVAESIIDLRNASKTLEEEVPEIPEEELLLSKEEVTSYMREDQKPQKKKLFGFKKKEKAPKVKNEEKQDDKGKEHPVPLSIFGEEDDLEETIPESTVEEKNISEEKPPEKEESLKELLDKLSEMGYKLERTEDVKTGPEKKSSNRKAAATKRAVNAKPEKKTVSNGKKPETTGKKANEKKPVKQTVEGEKAMANRVTASAKPITVKGKEYPSVKAAADAYKKDPAKIRRRLNDGWSIERAFELEK